GACCEVARTIAGGLAANPTREGIMRIVFVLASALLSGSALADTVRHPTVPGRFWGTWAPTADPRRDGKAIIVVSARGYGTGEAACKVQWGIAAAGAGGPISSAHMRCASLSTPEQKTELNRIIVP